MKPLLNLLEPEGYLEAFLSEPPENFATRQFKTPSGHHYGFVSELDLFTTVSEELKGLRQRLDRWLPEWFRKIIKPRVLFVGTPLSEYVLLPNNLSPEALTRFWLSELKEAKTAFLLVKDLPKQSPMLTESENRFSEQLLSHLDQAGFLVMSGQALGYVPIDFSSREEYLKKFLSNRRNNIKRKLKLFSKVSVQELRLDESIGTPLLETLYELYLNVYNNSYIHFEKLTFPFFKRIFTDSTNNGVAFLFYAGEKIIGFSLCFEVGDRLVEKYIGSLYPESREHNFYFLSWFYKLEYCLRHQLKMLIVGCTSAEIKAYLGAEFTQSYHAVYMPNPVLRWLAQKAKPLFEADRKTLEKLQRDKLQGEMSNAI